MDRRERKIIKHIMKEEQVRKALFLESMASVVAFLYADQQILFQFHCQLIMNHLKDLCKDCSMCCEICDIDLNPYDVERMAKFLKITEEQFVSKYCIPHPEEPSFFYRLKQKPCPFLKDKRCLIYQVRPNNCVFYPFLSSLQKEALQTYQKTKKVSINVPTWCHSAMKVKEFDDKIREIIRNAPKEEIESLQKHARTVLEKMARDYSYINFG